MAKKKADKAEKVQAPIHSYPGTKTEQLQRLYDDWFKCQRCELAQYRCDSSGQEIEDVVFCSGNPDSGVMIVGEAPGEEEAKTLIPFVGKSGKLVNQILAATTDNQMIKNEYLKYSKVTHTHSNERKFHESMFKWRDENFFLTNIVACRPPENRTPIPPEIKACSERLLNIIYIVDPVIIIASGKTAAEALLNKKMEVTMKRGELFDMTIKGKVGNVTYPVIVTLHPSFLLRTADWNVRGGNYTKTIGDYMKAMKVYDFLMEKNYNVPMPERGIP